MSFPKELKELTQWVSWKTEDRDGKKTKVLLRADGSYASSTNPETWDSYENVQKRKHDGIGFVFVKDIVGIDLDYAFYTKGKKKGELKDWAKKVLSAFDSYTEFSPTRIDGVPKGIHIIAKCPLDFQGIHYKIPIEKREERDVEESFECYVKGRFFTVTENVYENRSSLKKISEKQLDEWIQKLRPTRFDAPKGSKSAILPPDNEILNKIRSSRNGAKFQALFDRGDWSTLGFPSQSEADLSLSGSLMFFTKNDLHVADRLFRQSALFRPKWDEKHGSKTYGVMTLERATRPETMNWSDPTCDDPEDILREIRLFGDIQIEKTDIGFLVKAPIKAGIVFFEFTEISVSRQSIDAIVRVHLKYTNGEDSSPYTLRMDIRSHSAQTGLVTRLNASYGREHNWSLVTNNVFSALGDRVQSEQKVIFLTGWEYKEPEFLLYPFLQEKATNMFFSQPETGKTFLAMQLAACLASGRQFLSYPSKKGHKTLYVDYEDNEQVFSSRMHKICVGLGVDYRDVASKVGYLNPMGSVRDNIEIIRKNIADNGFSLAIFDAGGDAAGGSPNDEQRVIDLFNALQSLPCTRLILHHEPKQVNGVSDENSYYGTMYWRSRSRVAWRMVREISEEKSTIVKMVLSKKSNLGYVPPIYFQASFEDEADAAFNDRTIPGYYTKITTEPEKESEDGVSEDDILYVIDEQGSSFNELQERTGMSRTSLQRLLFSIERKGKVRRIGGTLGRGKSSLYFKNTA